MKKLRTASRTIEFDAAHRVPGHEGKCKHLHGHRYKAVLTVAAEALDELGRVVDFSVLKSVVGEWVDDNWDHNVLLWHHDPLLDVILRQTSERTPFIMDDIPTAENIAELLYKQSEIMLTHHAIRVVSVRVWETPNCYAEYSEHGNQ